MVRVKGRDSHLQRSTATPVSLPIDGFTSLGSSGFICRAQSGRIIVLAPASIFTAFLQASEGNVAARRPASVQQFGTRLEIHRRPLSAAQKVQHMEQQPVEYDGQQLQDKVTVEILLDETIDKRNTASTDLQRDADWRTCKLLGWAHLPSVAGLLSRLLKFNVWYVGWSEGKWGGAAETLAVLQLEDSSALEFSPPLLRSAARPVALGERVSLVSSPYGILAPFAFLNSVSHGYISNLLYTQSTPPSSSALSSSALPALFFTDTHILPGSEGCPVYDSSQTLIGLMAPPLRKWGTSGYVGGEVNAVLPMRNVLDMVATVIGEGFETLSNIAPLGLQPSPAIAVRRLIQNSISVSAAVSAALPSLLCLQAGTNWASGVRISPSLVLTNAHLLRPFASEGTNSVSVPVEARINGQWIRVEPIFIASQEDIALLELPEKAQSGFVPISLRSAEPQVGEAVAVLGYPQFGPGYEFDATLTVGVIGRVVQAAGRAVCICVSADVAAGNSGGMLIDKDGVLVGMVTNNVRDRLGKIIPKLNMSIPAERLRSVFSFAQSRDSSLLREYNEESPAAARVWKLQLAQRPPSQTPKVLEFIRKLEQGQISLPQAKL